jgi:hypothetical protein
MPPGPVEEAGQTARALVAALNPGMLSILLLNVIILSGLYIVSAEERANKNEIVKMIIAQCSSQR